MPDQTNLDDLGDLDIRLREALGSEEAAHALFDADHDADAAARLRVLSGVRHRVNKRRQAAMGAAAAVVLMVGIATTLSVTGRGSASKNGSVARSTSAAQSNASQAFKSAGVSGAPGPPPLVHNPPVKMTSCVAISVNGRSPDCVASSPPTFDVKAGSTITVTVPGAASSAGSVTGSVWSAPSIEASTPGGVARASERTQSSYGYRSLVLRLLRRGSLWVGATELRTCGSQKVVCGSPVSSWRVEVLVG